MMDSILSDPKEAFIMMLNERIGQLEENMFNLQQEIKKLQQEVFDMKNIIYCESIHVYINDDKMFRNDEYHDIIYSTIKSLHPVFLELMPIKKIYYITKTIKTPQIHLYIIFSTSVPYECMKQTINTIIITKLANASIKISSIFWKKITKHTEKEMTDYLDKTIFTFEGLE
jgi:hypothetical protein